MSEYVQLLVLIPESGVISFCDQKTKKKTPELDDLMNEILKWVF